MVSAPPRAPRFTADQVVRLVHGHRPRSSPRSGAFRGRGYVHRVLRKAARPASCDLVKTMNQGVQVTQHDPAQRRLRADGERTPRPPPQRDLARRRRRWPGTADPGTTACRAGTWPPGRGPDPRHPGQRERRLVCALRRPNCRSPSGHLRRRSGTASSGRAGLVQHWPGRAGWRCRGVRARHHGSFSAAPSPAAGFFAGAALELGTRTRPGRKRGQPALASVQGRFVDLLRG